MSTQLSEDPDVPQNIEPICGVKRKSEDASSELDIKKVNYALYFSLLSLQVTD